MSTAFRIVMTAAIGLAMFLASSMALGQVSNPRPGGRLYSVPGTGTPAFRPPYSSYYTPRYYTPRYSYRTYTYPSPYGSYYRPPYYSVPGMGVPAYPPPTVYPPAPVAMWRLGVTGTEWPGVGVRISTIEPESPAERMGIEVSDTIVQVNGNPIRSMYDLQNAVAASGGYARILVLDNRTNSYMWHNGSLGPAPAAALTL